MRRRLYQGFARISFDVANDQGLGEFALVPEVIEEPILADADRRDQLLDGGGTEAFVEGRGFGRIEDALPR
jgi:hypothetical protein